MKCVKKQVIFSVISLSKSIQIWPGVKDTGETFLFWIFLVVFGLFELITLVISKFCHGKPILNVIPGPHRLTLVTGFPTQRRHFIMIIGVFSQNGASVEDQNILCVSVGYFKDNLG